MNQAPSMDVRLHGRISPLQQVDNLEALWRSLEQDSRCSFFLSWSWIGSWLRLVQNRANLLLWQCRHEELLVAMAIVNIKAIRRLKFLKVKILTLHEVPDSNLDMYIEYNGVLARTGYENEVMLQLLTDVTEYDKSLDEIHLTRISIRQWQPDIAARLQMITLNQVEQATWIAPLTPPFDRECIVSRLNKRRRRIRRSLREYEQEGPLTIESASTLPQALQFFHQMGRLHTQRWNRVGAPGAFANTDWVNFHRAVISSAFDRGEIQLLRTRCGARDIGYIYNFLYRNSVLGLQTGFAVESNKHLCPGFVSDILAMQLNGTMGFTEYDLMADDWEYKQTFATGVPSLVSVKLRKPRVKFMVESALIKTRRLIRRLKAKLATKSVAARAAGRYRQKGEPTASCGKALIVAPHCDDAALALGGALAARVLWPATLLTVFSRTNYTASGPGEIESVTAQRKLEEQAAVGALTEAIHFLDLDSCCLGTRTAESSDRASRMIVEAISSLTRNAAFEIVLFPCGIGNHPDHLALRALGQRLSSLLPVGFFEDMPYQAFEDEQRQWRHCDRLVPKLLASPCAPKRQILAAYRSQLRDHEINAVCAYHELRGGEIIYTAA